MAKGKSTSRVVRPDTKSQTVRALFIIGLLLVIATGYLFWRQVISSPRNVFNGMLENSLKTRSVAKHTIQDSGVQKLDQSLQLQSGSQKLAHSLTTLTQGGDDTAVVKTESIGTPTSDYVRYTDIKTDQTNQAGEPLGFNNVLGIWGHSQPATPGETGGELYGEAALGIIPFGFLTAPDRQDLLRLISERDIYAVDYSEVKKEIQDGHPRYTYNVEVRPEDYVIMLKQFAKAVGLNQLESFEPSSFKDSPKLRFELTVDVWSRQLVKATFLDSGLQETYGSYGAWVPTMLPEKAIRVEELQNRLQSIQ